MSAQAGNLHWRRARLTLEAGSTDVDTLLRAANQAYNTTGGPSDPVDPPLGVYSAGPIADGTEPASRCAVIPLPPLAAWDDVTIGEPYFDTDTNTVHVPMSNNSVGPCADGVTIEFTASAGANAITVTFVNCVLSIEQVGTPTVAALEAALALVGWVYASGLPGGTLLSAANEVDGPFSGTGECVDGTITVDWNTILNAGETASPSYNDDPNIALPGSMSADCSAASVEVNVLFWAPHTKEGPGKCDTYNAQIE